MSPHSSAVSMAVKGTVIALVIWLVLYLAKESLGRTAAMVLAGVVFLSFVLVFWARMWLRARGGRN